ncbi:hypothetical protein [Bradyrhizobium japonicum]|uniref:hypothetical protein n=1 Tax=Bradyrhizobium japonicum TaxID=375 RepID=UPI0012FDFE51|nr:hypothetical protein [Bradyrhizobium japonicum]
MRPQFKTQVAEGLHSGDLVSKQTVVDGLELAADAFIVGAVRSEHSQDARSPCGCKLGHEAEIRPGKPLKVGIPRMCAARSAVLSKAYPSGLRFINFSEWKDQFEK